MLKLSMLHGGCLAALIMCGFSAIQLRAGETHFEEPSRQSAVKAATGTSDLLPKPVDVGNGGFELGIRGEWIWLLLMNNGAQGTFLEETQDVQEGSKTLKVNIDKLGSYNWSAQIINRDWDVEAGKSYKLSMWFKDISAGDDVVIVNFAVGHAVTFQGYASTGTVSLEKEWQELILYFTSPMTTNGTTDRIQMSTSFRQPGICLVDNFTVTETQLKGSYVSEDSTQIVLEFIELMAAPNPRMSKSVFDVTVNGVTYPVATIARDSKDTTKILLTIHKSLAVTDRVVVTYMPGVLLITQSGNRILPFIEIINDCGENCMNLPYSGGSGTENDPYQIATAQDLIELGDDPNNYDKHFILTSDIDLSGYSFNQAVIAPDTAGGSTFDGTPFTGSFNGNDFVIRNLTISDGASYVGLFGKLDKGAAITSLGLENASLRDIGSYVGSLVGYSNGSISNCNSTGTISGISFVGGLAGYCDNGTVSHCSNMGTVSGSGYYAGGLVGYSRNGGVSNSNSAGTVTGNVTVGGLVGINYEGSIFNSYSTSTVTADGSVGGLVAKNYGNLSNCYNTGTVTGNGSGSVGGLVGWNYSGISNCYNIGRVRGSDDYVGGLVGAIAYGSVFNCYNIGEVSGFGQVGGLVGYSNQSSVSNCYSMGAVSGENYVGGLMGRNDSGSISNCFSTSAVEGDFVGGLVGASSGSISSSFWDIETSDQTYSAGGTGLSTAEMKNMDTYLHAGWDFGDETIPGSCDFWLFEAGAYPILRVFAGDKTNQPEGQGTADSPYLIQTIEDLGWVWYRPMAYYRLEADLDLSGITWGIAVVPWFGGEFDGNSHVIEHLIIQGGGHLGLFGVLGPDATVRNLGLKQVSVAGSGDFVGGLVGFNYCGSVFSCYSTGIVNGEMNIGGLVACNNCGNVFDSYSTCEVSGDDTVGGLVGRNDSGSISHCYSTGTVNGDRNIGGLVGHWDCRDKYRSTANSVSNSFWDIDTSGLDHSSGGAGLATEEMKSSYWIGLQGLGEDPNQWVLDAGRDYPRLAWENTPGQQISLPVIDWLEGNGTVESPYQLASIDQLVSLSRASSLWDKHILLVNDLDLAGLSWSQAVIPQISGSFDGNGHVIRHLSIAGTNPLGFFGSLLGSVENLGLEQISIEGTSDYIGALAGYNSGNVSNSYSTGTFSGIGNSRYVGGLVGYNSGNVSNSYSTGVVVNGSGSCIYVGGLVGSNSGNVSNSYSTGTISESYLVGGFVASNSGSVSNSFWDIETSGLTDSAGGTGRTTAQMQNIDTYLDAGWDFVGETQNGNDNIWQIDDGQGYPRLWWKLDVDEPDDNELVIGDFEDGLGNWKQTGQQKAALAISTIGVTSGNQSLAITPPKNTFTWAFVYEGMIDTSKYHSVSMDVTWKVAEWAPTSGMWAQVDLIAINSDADGWKQFQQQVNQAHNWSPYNGDRTVTLMWDISSYNATGANWMQLVVSTNMGGVSKAGNIYVDNIKLIGDAK
ncbi:GLUG motif-containing protein [Planctomycetota bacterium]